MEREWERELTRSREKEVCRVSMLAERGSGKSGVGDPPTLSSTSSSSAGESCWAELGSAEEVVAMCKLLERSSAERNFLRGLVAAPPSTAAIRTDGSQLMLTFFSVTGVPSGLPDLEEEDLRMGVCLPARLLVRLLLGENFLTLSSSS